MNRQRRLKEIEDALRQIPDADMIAGEKGAMEYRIQELYTAVKLLAEDMKEEIELQEQN